MAVAITRTELDAAGLRAAAAPSKDAAATRRMLALALVLEGHGRAAAARATGMDRQRLRDWVHRYNEAGLAGLYNKPNPGAPPRKLTTEQEAAVAEWVRRQRDDGDVVGHGELRREVPSGLIEQQRCVPTRRDLGRNHGKVQVHRLGVAPRQDQAGRLALAGADGAEDAGRGGLLIVRGRGPGAAQRPATGDLVFLADSGLVAEPDLYVGGIEVSLVRDRRQRGEKVFFLKASIAPAAWA